MVEGDQPLHSQVFEWDRLRNKCCQQQGLDQPVIVDKGRGRWVRRTEVMLSEQCGAQLLLVDLPGLLKSGPHGIGQGFIARIDHAVEIANWNQLSNLDVVPSVHQQLEEDPQTSSRSLERSSQIDQDRHEGRRERVGKAEYLVGAQLGQQHVMHSGRKRHRGERCVQHGLRLIIDRLEKSTVRHQWQVGVVQFDRAEAICLELELVSEAHPLNAWDAIAHEFAEVALASDDRHDRDRAASAGRFHQFGQL